MFFGLIDTEVNAKWELFQKENTGVSVPDLSFKWIALNATNSIGDILFKEPT